MKYVNQTFTAPVCTKPLSDLEYDLRVGNITQQEFDTLKLEEDKTIHNLRLC